MKPMPAQTHPPASPRVELRRVYGVQASERLPGKRVLVDRVWPRGRRKEDLRLDLWARELGPSDELRRWFGHRPERWPEFQRRYRAELQQPEQRALIERLAEMTSSGALTLLFGARDEERNQAVVLREVLTETLRSGTDIKE